MFVVLVDACVDHGEWILSAGRSFPSWATRAIECLLQLLRCGHTCSSCLMIGSLSCRDRERHLAQFHSAVAELQQSALLQQYGIDVETPAVVTATQVMSVATAAATAVSTIGKHIQANSNGKNEQSKPHPLMIFDWYHKVTAGSCWSAGKHVCKWSWQSIAQ